MVRIAIFIYNASPARVKLWLKKNFFAVAEQLSPGFFCSWLAGQPARFDGKLRDQKLLWRPIKILALYLPQFHVTKTNELFWGSKFTEWTMVNRARPLFPGHDQPRVPLPGQLGAYDLVEDTEIFERQASLASQAGIFGFNFYFYWSAGERQLEQGLESFLKSKADTSFCVTWVNEDWTRAWDGSSGQVIWSQNYSKSFWAEMIADLIPVFSDERYIRVDGRPVLYIYRPAMIPFLDSLETIAEPVLREAGIVGLHLIAFETFGEQIPVSQALRGTAQFPPHPSSNNPWSDKALRFRSIPGQVAFYDDVAQSYVSALRANGAIQPSVTLGWDNSPRRPYAPTLFLRFSPQILKRWILDAARQLSLTEGGPARGGFLTINAWNEWSEGSYLEPDVSHGYAALNTVHDAMTALGATKQPILLIIHDTEIGGSQLQTAKLADTLNIFFGFFVHVLSLSDEEGPLAESIKNNAALVSIGPSKTDNLALYISELRDAGVKNAFVLSFAAAGVVNKLLDEKFIVTQLVHELPAMISEKDVTEFVNQVDDPRINNVFPSESVLNKWRQSFGIDGSLAVVQPQPIWRQVDWARDLTDLNDDFLASNGERRSREGTDRVMVVGVGHGDYRKGIDRFCTTLSSLGDAFQGTWIGTYDSQLVPRDSSVALLGQKSDPTRWIRAADVLYLSSREDPFPTVVLEAIVNGTPVIAHRGATGFEDTDLAQQIVFIEDSGDPTIPFQSIPSKSSEISDLVSTANLHRVSSYTNFLLKMQNLAPKQEVSVVIPSFNHLPFLTPRLTSVVAQGGGLREIVVVDDGSTDESPDHLNHFAINSPIPVRVICNQQSGGSAVKTWLQGVRECKSEFIWIAESDDSAADEFIDCLLPLLEASSRGMIFADSTSINELGVSMDQGYRFSEYLSQGNQMSLREDADCPPEDWKAWLLPRNPIMNVSAVLFRKAPLLAALELAEKNDWFAFGAAADWLIYSEIARLHGFLYKASSLNFHRQHSGSMVAWEKQKHEHLDLVSLTQAELNRWS